MSVERQYDYPGSDLTVKTPGQHDVDVCVLHRERGGGVELCFDVDDYSGWRASVRETYLRFSGSDWDEIVRYVEAERKRRSEDGTG